MIIRKLEKNQRQMQTHRAKIEAVSSTKIVLNEE